MVLIFLILIGAILLIGLLIAGGFLLLVKLGVIVHEARKPAYYDHQDYSLDQGHDVGKRQ